MLNSRLQHQFFTTLNDIWAKSEEIWEGVFSLIAWYVRPSFLSLTPTDNSSPPFGVPSIIIFMMGVTMMRIDRSKVKWQQKLEGAFDKKAPVDEDAKDRKEGRSGKWTLFLLPMITVLREGLEAVVFVGGVHFILTRRKLFIRLCESFLL